MCGSWLFPFMFMVITVTPTSATWAALNDAEATPRPRPVGCQVPPRAVAEVTLAALTVDGVPPVRPRAQADIDAVVARTRGGSLPTPESVTPIDVVEAVGWVSPPMIMPTNAPPEADEATKAGVSATVAAWEACVVAGDRLRLYALFTDAGLQQLFTPDDAAEIRRTAAGWLTLPEWAAGPPNVMTSLDVQQVRRLPDGRAAAVVYDLPGPPSSGFNVVSIWLFAPSADEWLIDAIVGGLISPPGVETPPA